MPMHARFIEEEGASRTTSRARQGWLLAMQLLALGLLTLALLWSPSPETPLRAFLGALAVLSLLVCFRRSWRFGVWTAMLGGLGLATACWLSLDRTWDLPLFAASGASIPLITPCMLGAAVACGVWGLAVRGGVKSVPLAQATLVGGLGLGLLGTLYALLINCSPAFRALYQIEPAQTQELWAAVLLYPLAFWLGSVGIRAESRWNILFPGMALIFIGTLLLWQVRA